MVLSLTLQPTDQEKWGNFIAQWAPTWLISGVYNKLKLKGTINSTAEPTE
jgi:hypothetical protein